MRVGLILTVVAMSVAPASAQTDPIRCWWRTSQGAVTLGEEFTATLTCAVREQETTRTVPDQSRLDAAVVQLAPFEVLAGAPPADLRSPTHRYFQYRYTLRIIDRDVIGQDARFPDIQIPFRVQTRTNAEWMDGRDRTYTIPSSSVRVLSLVPADATDIRDSVDADFARVDALEFRARWLGIAAYALAALGLIVGTPALVGLARGRRKVSTDDATPARRTVRRAVHAELAAVARESAGGWTPDLVHRALAALRLAAADALGKPIGWRAAAGADAGAAHLSATSGFLRKTHLALWSSATPTSMRRALASLPADARTDRRSHLEELEIAMRVLTSALYRAEFTSDGVDEVFTRAREAVQQLQR